MIFIDAIKFGFTNYINFNGVVGRKIFWFWILFLFICYNIFLSIQRATGFPLSMFFIASIGLPTIALMVRRLRDAGFSPALLTIWLVPFLMSISAMNSLFTNPNFAPDPIAEGNAGYIPVHAFATGIVGILLFVFGILIGSLLMAILWLQPTRTKEQGNKRLRE